MGITFAILKKIDGDDTTVLQYDEGVIARRLPRLVLEKLPLLGILKRKYSREDVETAVAEAWGMLVTEFKQETLKLR